MDEKTKHIFIKDFGCRINQYDSRVIGNNLNKMGFVLTGDIRSADLVIVNTCGVTHTAEKKCVKYIRRIQKKYPEKEITAVGCSVRDEHSQVFDEAAKILKHFKYLDHPKFGINEFSGHNRAFVKVQQGCNGLCSYCNVRKLKRPYFVKNPEQVKSEIDLLAKKYFEIVLCATNILEYKDILKLIDTVKNIKRNFRWRFSSINPLCINKNMIDKLDSDEKFCRHFHIPVQSGSDEILRKMRRGYKLNDVERAVEEIKTGLSNCSVSFDIIVGFPGEEGKDFQKTIDLLKKYQPVRVHVFRYSDRPGTPAFRYSSKVPERIKKERMKIVKSTAEKTAKNNFEYSVNKIKNVVLEKKFQGYTEDYIPVKIVSCEKNIVKQTGNLIKVKVTGYNNKFMEGIVV
ncbi:MAG: radical SAM protein [Elusimicrobiota bacterium]